MKLKKTPYLTFLIYHLLTLKMCRFRLEDQQRGEKRNREAKGDQYSPRWFNLTGEITPTPWGDLEVYEYNGKYTEHRARIDSSNSNDEIGITSIGFNPWQYTNSPAE